jgi:signal transduction histidine kinase
MDRKPSKFAIGDKVEIVGRLRFVGRRGAVIAIDKSRHSHTLDKYTVRFDGADETAVFWDFELKISETCVFSVSADITDLKTAEEAKRIAEQHAEEAEHVAKGLSAAAQKLIQAHDDERAEIARELHDDLDRLALLSMSLHRIRQSPPGSAIESNPEIAEAVQQVDELVNQIQTLSQRLHSSRLEYLGLAAAAADFCKELSDKKSVTIHFASEGIPEELLAKISVCLFHVLQEALRIATEHSTSRVFEVSLSVESNEIHLIVRDSEVGFDPGEALKGSEVALTLIRERLNILGGRVWIESQGKRGTTIHACVPINSN